MQPATSHPRNARAFTLIEFIGVLAIITILAAALVPALIRRISHANATRETANLATLADALKQQVLRQKKIPNAAGAHGWVALVQTELNLAPHNISTNAIGHARAFLIDPALSVGTNTATTLPFIQTSNGVASANNVRFLLVSSLTLPLPFSSGVASSSAAFSNIWHTLDDGVPAGWGAEWAGKGDLLRIQRIELNNVFRRLILNPTDPKGYGKFAIETSIGTSQAKPVTGILSALYIEGSLVGLYNTNNASTTDFLEGREFLHADRSYVFENGRWRAQIFDGKAPPASDPYASVFNESMALFSNASPNTQAGNNVSQSTLISMFYAFMLDYYRWALTGFQGVVPQDIVERDFSDIQAALAELEKR